MDPPQVSKMPINLSDSEKFGKNQGQQKTLPIGARAMIYTRSMLVFKTVFRTEEIGKTDCLIAFHLKVLNIMGKYYGHVSNCVSYLSCFHTQMWF